MTSPGLPAGTVTVADLYREMVGMRADVVKALTRIEVLDARNTDADHLHADHEARLRLLETFKWKMIGGMLAIGAVSGGLGAWAGVLLGRH